MLQFPAAGAQTTDVQQQAHARVQASITESLPASMRAQAKIHITVTAPRGAARQPCRTEWEWGEIQVQRWQRIHIPVSCEGEAGSLVAKVQVQAPVQVATQALPKNHRLQATDITPQQQSVDSPEALMAASQLVGMQLRRAVPQGQVLLPQHVVRPLFAKKGERIEIRADTDGIVVNVQGIALRNGYAGERIRARNAHSQAWVEGVLIAPGVLQAETTQPGHGVKVQSGD